MIQLINTASIDIENADITIPPYSTGTLQKNTESVGPGSYNVPAGAYELRIYNDGLQPITVDGQSVETGDTFLIEAKANPNSQRLDLTPAVTIVVPPGGAASYYTISPSS